MTSLGAIARRFLFVRESDGLNHGAFVEFFQRFTGNAPGDSWCASFESVIEDLAYRGHAPTPKSASCAYKLSHATTQGYVVPSPALDDLYFFLDRGIAHHIGIVTGLNPLTGIAGNTSPDGLSVNGTGVFEHALHASDIVFVRLPPTA